MVADQAITCPWCGTSYTTHWPNCRNCGGPLPLPVVGSAPTPEEIMPEPPPAPRSFRHSTLWRQLLADGWAIVGAVFSLLGLIFAVTGMVLNATLIALFIGLPFTGLGIAFLTAGIPVLVWRYTRAQRTLEVLRIGEAALGTIVDVREEYHVRVNNRHPWTITYRFSVLGQEFEGKTTTLRPPGHAQRSGQPVSVLYLENDPNQNTIYPLVR
jgi:hypothetical protein